MQTNLRLFASDVSERFLSLTRFVNDPYTLYKRLKASRLARFRKTRKHANQGKTQCNVISKATFTKTAIKPKLDRFSLKTFSAAINQYTIKSPIFVVVVSSFAPTFLLFCRHFLQLAETKSPQASCVRGD